VPTAEDQYLDHDPIVIGQYFRERRAPRRVWRVDEKSGQLYRLVSVDRPNVVRYPSAEVLLDDHRYVPAPAEEIER
jgi:hypothetical protein